MPTTTITVKMSIVIVPIIRVSCTPPSIMLNPFDRNRSFIDSQNPTTYIAQATAFANEKMSPIEPPNSGPNDLINFFISIFSIQTNE